MGRRKQQLKQPKRPHEDGPIAQARGRFVTFIAAELDARADVKKTDLATAFMKQEDTLVKRLGAYSIHKLLKRWAEDILKHSIGNAVARASAAQFMLPLNLAGIEMPAAFSFTSMAGGICH